MRWIVRRFTLWLPVAAVMLTLLLFLTDEGPLPQDLDLRLDRLSADYPFDFITWEIEALARKAAYGVLAPQRFMTEEQRARFVLAYLADVRQVSRLEYEIERTYADPAVTDPATATAEQQAQLADLRRQLRHEAPLAEAIVGEQGSMVLRTAGIGWWGQILPPISGTFTPLPYLLVVSPRERIESVYQRSLRTGLTVEEQETLEQRIEEAEPDLAALVTPIGGLSAYPAMLDESSSIDWVADVMVHEWSHHYLGFFPLGWEYEPSPAARIINETTASLMGEWAGQEIVLRFYAPLLSRPKSLPDPLTPGQPQAGAAPAFDFQAEMHRTRVNVDRLLAEGKVRDAEWYMEAQRRYFVAQGYILRRLNQAYFAFHGAYASRPGAAGQDPLGPAVRRIWALSATPGDFLRRMASLTTLDELQLAAQRLVAQ
jgi:hypothetical protein